MNIMSIAKKFNLRLLIPLSISATLHFISLRSPWWIMNEYWLNHSYILASRTLFILPSVYVILSEEYVVEQILPINGKIAASANYCMFTILISIYLQLAAIMLLLMRKETKNIIKLIVSSSILITSAPLIFYLTLESTHVGWPLFNSISGSLIDVPPGKRVEWNLAVGFYSSILASIMSITTLILNFKSCIKSRNS